MNVPRQSWPFAWTCICQQVCNGSTAMLTRSVVFGRVKSGSHSVYGLASELVELFVVWERHLDGCA